MATLTFKVGASWFTPNVTTVKRNTITAINIVDSYVITGNEIDSWDASEDNDGSIMCYVTGTTLTIAGNGSGAIKFNADQSYWLYTVDGKDYFKNCTSFTGLSLIDTSNCTTLNRSFRGLEKITSLDISHFDISNVTNLYQTFCYCKKLTSLPIENWDVSNVTTMAYTFYQTGALTLPIENWNVSNVTSLDHTFAHSTSLNNLDLTKWDVSNVTNMNATFCGMKALTSLDLSTWDTSKVTCFPQFFEGCSNLETIYGLENFDTSKSVCFAQMFRGCSKLKELDLSSFDTRNADNGTPTSDNGSTSGTTWQMITNTHKLEKITLGKYFTFEGKGVDIVPAEDIGTLPTPSATYIEEADGNWYTEDFTAYAPADVPNFTEMTYYASKKIVNDVIDTRVLNYKGLKYVLQSLNTVIDAGLDSKADKEHTHTVADITDYASIQADWNQNDSEALDYVKNRPFYTEGRIILSVTEATTLEDGMFSITNAIEGVVVGQTYVVTYNNIRYRCNASDYEMEGTNYIALGNLSLVGGTASDEPFVLLIVPLDMVETVGAGVMILDTTGATILNVSITEDGYAIHRLDNKYLDIFKDNLINIAKEKIVTNDVNEPTETRGGFPDLTINDIYIGQELIVVIDGTKYKTKVFEDTTILDGCLLAGNPNVLSNTIAIVGEPFLLQFFDSKTNVIVSGEVGTQHIASVWIENGKLDTIDEKYLPDSVSKEDHTHTISEISDLTATATELNYVSGATSNIQEQIDKNAGLKTEGTVYTINEVSVTAGTGAEIFNDYTNNIASGAYSHAEGCNTLASSWNTHAEGNSTKATNSNAHAEGYYTEASGDASHAEGGNTKASGSYSHAEGYYTEAGNYSHAEGSNTKALEPYSHAEGSYSQTTGSYAHAEGYRTVAASYGHAEGNESKATGNTSHAEGTNTEASGQNSHTEGFYTKATSSCAHAEGDSSEATGSNSHAEGRSSKATNGNTHAEGYYTEASGYQAHAEGNNSKATNENTHAEGYFTTASGSNSHAEGYYTEAKGYASHSEGYYTIASGQYQHVQGKNNVEDTENKYAHIVGNGAYGYSRSNAHTLDWDGNAWYQGSVEATALILSSPNGTRFQITVGDDGVLTATELTVE